MRWLLLLLGTALGLILLLALLLGELWTTPVHELRTVLGYCRFLQVQEDAHLGSHGRYANLKDLLGRGSGKYRVAFECQDGYCFHVEATERGYSIRIFPNRNLPKGSRRLVSLYADETQVVRVSYGSTPADSTSAVLSNAEIQRFKPR